MYLFHSLTYRPTSLSCLAYPFWRVYSNPLQHSSCGVIPPCLCAGNSVTVFHLHNGFQLFLFGGHAVCSSRCISVGLLIPPSFWGRQVIPMWLFLGTSTIFNTSITHFAVFATTWLSIFYLLWDGRAKDLGKTLSFKHCCASSKHL